MKHKKTNLMKNTVKGSSDKNLAVDLQWKTEAIYKILNTLHHFTDSGYRGMSFPDRLNHFAWFSTSGSGPEH
jgi:hypothetical protein